MLAFEYLAIEFSEMTDIDDNGVLKVYNHVLKDFCGVEPDDKKNFSYLTKRITELREESSSSSKEEESNPDIPKPKAKDGFCTEFYKLLLDFPTDELLLQMTGYDLTKAEQLYCMEDREDVKTLLKTYVSRLQIDHSVMLQATAYGFGGEASSGSGDTKPQVSEALNSDNAKDLQAAFN